MSHLARDERKRMRSESDWETRIRPRTQTGVQIGILFCVIGGAMLASSFVLPWATHIDPATHAVVRTFYINDLYNLATGPNTAPNYKYLLAYAVVLVGFACAVLSALELAGERGIERLRRISPPAALGAAVIGAISTIAMVYFLSSDVFGDASVQSSYGSAVFVSVFGSVLTVSGGLTMVLDYRHRIRTGAGFRAMPGNHELRAALRPTGRTRHQWTEPAEDEEIKEEVLSKRERRHSAAESVQSGEVCPTCNSAVMANWKLCPICGTEL